MREEHRCGRLRLEQRQGREVAVRGPRRQLAQDPALRPARHEADLLAGIAAKDRAVVDQCDAEAEPRRGQRGGASGYATADDHDVEAAGVHRLVWEPAQRPAPGAAPFIDAVRWRRRIGTQVNRIAAAFEAGQVVQAQRHGPVPERDGSAVFPAPVLSARAEFLRKHRAVDRQREPARMVRRHPVLGADPHVVHACLGDPDHVPGIRDRTPEAMGQQVWRAHLRLELGVHHPAAVLVEVLRLDEDSACRARTLCRSDHCKGASPAVTRRHGSSGGPDRRFRHWRRTA